MSMDSLSNGSAAPSPGILKTVAERQNSNGSGSTSPSFRVSWGTNITFEGKDEDGDKSGSKLFRKPTGVYADKKKAELKLRAVPESQTLEDSTTTANGIEVEVVGRELKPHHFGPVFVTKATIRRTGKVPLGLTLCSSAIDPGKDGHHLPRGTMIGELTPDSPAAKCGAIAEDDKIVAINEADVRGWSHEEVVEEISSLEGDVTLSLERSTRFNAAEITEASILQRGCGAIPAKIDKKKNNNKKKRNSSKKLVDLSSAVEIVIHRHPNTNGLQIGVHGGFEENEFPFVVTATHPRSPYLPLVEGGELAQYYEMLAVENTVIVGMRHNDIIQLLKNSGEEVRMKVIQPQTPNVKAPRKITDFFENPADDDETQMLLSDVRRVIYTWSRLVTTRPREQGETTKDYEFTSIEQFQEMAKNDVFMEWMQHVSGHFYGIPKKPTPRSGMPKGLAAMKELSKSREELLTIHGDDVDKTISPPEPEINIFKDDDASTTLHGVDDVRAAIKSFAEPKPFEFKASPSSAKKRHTLTPEPSSSPKRQRTPLGTSLMNGSHKENGSTKLNSENTVESNLNELRTKIGAVELLAGEATPIALQCADMRALLDRVVTGLALSKVQTHTSEAGAPSPAKDLSKKIAALSVSAGAAESAFSITKQSGSTSDKTEPLKATSVAVAAGGSTKSTDSKKPKQSEI